MGINKCTKYTMPAAGSQIENQAGQLMEIKDWISFLNVSST